MPCWPVKHIVPCRPIKPIIAYFYQYFSPNVEIFYYFHQLFIIFTNIIINNTYKVIATPTVHVHRAATGPTTGTGRARARAVARA
jgi:hypothetical protein